MNYTKLETMLCLALQDGDGPFPATILFEGEIQHCFLNKEEIENISEWFECDGIFLREVKTERRWRKRSFSDRRNKGER